jgi:hypothetical protein
MESTAASAALSAEQQQLYRDLQEQMAIDGTRQQYETNRLHLELSAATGSAVQ